MQSGTPLPRIGLLNPEAQAWLRNSLGAGGDGRVPCLVGVDRQAWHNGFKRHRERLEAVAERCPAVRILVPPASDHGRTGRETVTDRWGCRWLYNEVSNDGAVIGHPMESWDALGAYRFPDPETYLDWKALEQQLAEDRAHGSVARVDFEHGFYYLRLTYLRGFSNLMMDLAEESAEFLGLVARVTEIWEAIARRVARLKPDLITFADDLGMQHGLPVSPHAWRAIIKPGLARIFSAAKATGAGLFLHTDGYIVDIIPDLIECGVDILNPQDLLNGLGTLRREANGKVAIDLDIDRQTITPFGTPHDIRDHIALCVKTLGSPAGGLSLTYGAYTGVPIENLEAVLRAMQEWHDYWARDGRATP